MRGDRVKTQPLRTLRERKRKALDLTMLRRGSGLVDRNRYADSEAGSIKLCHEWTSDLAIELLAAVLLNELFEQYHQQCFADRYDNAVRCRRKA